MKNVIDTGRNEIERNGSHKKKETRTEYKEYGQKEIKASKRRKVLCLHKTSHPCFCLFFLLTHGGSCCIRKNLRTLFAYFVKRIQYFVKRIQYFRYVSNQKPRACKTKKQEEILFFKFCWKMGRVFKATQSFLQHSNNT